MTVVIDSSVVVAALIDRGSIGEWAETILRSESLAAPHLMAVEVANILRRTASFGEITDDVAVLAHGDLMSLPVEFFPYGYCGERVWELRPTCRRPTPGTSHLPRL